MLDKSVTERIVHDYKVGCALVEVSYLFTCLFLSHSISKKNKNIFEKQFCISSFDIYEAYLRLSNRGGRNNISSFCISKCALNKGGKSTRYVI